jgi:hypothetical protein
MNKVGISLPNTFRFIIIMHRLCAGIYSSLKLLCSNKKEKVCFQIKYNFSHQFLLSLNKILALSEFISLKQGLHSNKSESFSSLYRE